VKISTTASVSKSDSECTPSATIAALRPNVPARSLAIVNVMFTTAPHKVTFRISFSLFSMILSLSCKIHAYHKSDLAMRLELARERMLRSAIEPM
jgi:hypothetical protein